MTDAEIVFDAAAAAVYDVSPVRENEPDVIAGTVAVLAELADGGPALELAIGTGRIGLPLAQRGIAVHGIDVSEPMVAQLRAKPGGDAIGVTIGDMATTRLDRTFRLAYVVFNTISNLETQADQVTCFATTADHLEPGGRFVVEVTVPELRRLPWGETTVLFASSPQHVAWDDYSGYDGAGQVAWSHHLLLDGGRVERFSTRHRHVWPSELDLMARMAGLELRHRWAGWDRSPFTGESRSHVSVWQKPG